MIPDSYLLKLAWADQHLNALANEIQWWVASEPYRITEDLDPQSGNRTVSVEPFGNPPLKLSLLAGDAVHNVRSGLDHLALALAEAHIGGPVPDDVEKNSQFPIYSKRQGFKDGRKRRIGSIHPKAQAAIKRLQPYRRCKAWQQHPLWILRELSDFDKHRRLPLVGIYANLAQAALSGDVFIEYLQTHGSGGPLNQKTPLLTWRGIVHPRTGTEVDMNYEIALRVAFSDQGPSVVAHRDVMEQLGEIRSYVATEVIPKLQPFL